MTEQATNASNSMVHRRAVEAGIWGMPAVNYEMMCQAFARDLGGAPNQIAYWSRLLDWHNQTLTPNPDAIYLMAFLDTTGGPVVLEIPAVTESSITGSIDDAWQTAIEDVGIAGLDAGKGGKYLILPPGHDNPVDNDTYFVLRPETYGSYALLRSNLSGGTDTDIERAVEYGKNVALYPLLQAEEPPQTTYIDAAGVLFDATIPYDERFYEALARRVHAEPWLTRDKAMIDTLRSLGIEKGKPYAPDNDTRQVLASAIADTHEWVAATYEGLYEQKFYEQSNWALPITTEFAEAIQKGYSDPDVYPVDIRGVTYSWAFFSAKHFGAGQFYLLTITEHDGNELDGSYDYQLVIPANVPVDLYWSVTAYDRDTHTLIRDVPWASRSSNTSGLKSNSDGTVLHFGPTAPVNDEVNWIPTRTGARFELMFRFYGPQKALFDKTWQLPDVTRT